MAGTIEQQLQTELKSLGYSFAELAGLGETGPVYRGRCQATNEPVAIKVLNQKPNPHDPPLPTDVAGYVRLIAVHQVAEKILLVSPWIEATSLAATLRSSGPRSNQQAIEIVRKVAATLTALHEQRRTHGSLKPSDVLLSKDNTVYILDAGWPRSAERIDDPYAPPVNDDATQADIYRLGGILYASLTGQAPAPVRKSPHSIVDIALLRPDLPRDLAEICRGCLATSLSERYATVAEVGEDLDRCERAETIRSRTLGPLGAAATVFADAPYAFVTLAAVAVVLLLLSPEIAFHNFPLNSRRWHFEAIAPAGALTGLILGAFIKLQIQKFPTLIGACVGCGYGLLTGLLLPVVASTSAGKLQTSWGAALQSLAAFLPPLWISLIGMPLIGGLLGIGWSSLSTRDARWRSQWRWWFAAAVVCYLLSYWLFLFVQDFPDLRTPLLWCRRVTMFFAGAACTPPLGSFLSDAAQSMSGMKRKAPGHAQLMVLLSVLAVTLLWRTMPVAAIPTSSSFFVFTTLTPRQAFDPAGGWLAGSLTSSPVPTILLIAGATFGSLLLAVCLRAPTLAIVLLGGALGTAVAYLIATRIEQDLLWSYRLLPMLVVIAGVGVVAHLIVNRLPPRWRLALRSENESQQTKSWADNEGWLLVGFTFGAILIAAIVLPPLWSLTG
ncbi:protein kinase domain-containing protein [Anatilimnocola floriformis]|uniref:protein kinase domain-containing protein n=1 Tax=Anatilimnocola floriformis TaxID=2948575 RepID=UPI0020C45E3F|nr:protein kinase [Anatilimnocola floriformis]